AFSPDETAFVLKNRIWDITNNAPRPALDEPPDEIHAVLFSQDGNLLLFGAEPRDRGDAHSGRGAVRFHEWRNTGKETRAIHVPHKAYCLQISPDGKYLAIGGYDMSTRRGVASLWDYAKGTLLASVREHTNSIEWISFSPDGKFLATADRNSLSIWNVESLPKGE